MVGRTPRLLFLNGSLRGVTGNTAAALAEAARLVGGRGVVELRHLAEDSSSTAEIVQAIQSADGFLLGTGVYWASCGSPLQKFIEVVTALENTDAFFGKPVGVVVTMDSVGGVDVASQLLSVFGAFGCVVPPCTTLILSRVSQNVANDGDVWSMEDLEVVVDNLLTSCLWTALPWRRWPVRALNLPPGSWRDPGPFDHGSPLFARTKA